MMKNKILFTLFLVSLSPLYATDFLKTTYHFENLSVNYVDWSDATQKSSNAHDFSYVEFEGGTGHKWGGTYIFTDIRNPSRKYNEKSKNSLSFALKPTIDINIKDTFAFHLQDYEFNSQSYKTNDAVVGFSYKYRTNYGFWAQPFVGYHYKMSTFYSGEDGYMFGWLFNYAYKEFSLFQWHEMTFARDKKDGYGDTTGVQGSIKFWWNTKSKISLGVQYRYAYYELGKREYQWGGIYSLKYNF